MKQKAKRILTQIGFLCSIPVIIGAFVFANMEERKAVCNRIKVHFMNPEMRFVQEEEVVDMMKEAGLSPNESLIKEIPFEKIENELKRVPWIEKAEVYVSSNNEIHARIFQNEPLLRVQFDDSSGFAYYLDKNALAIPLNKNFSVNVPVATVQFPKLDVALKGDLLSLANRIETDTFWSQVITQINVRKDKNIELISSVGNVCVIIGSVLNLEDKLNRLFVFYQKGIQEINWENVKELDLRFKNQLVCRRYHKENQIAEKKELFTPKRSINIPVMHTTSATTQLAKANNVPSVRPVNAKKTQVDQSKVKSAQEVVPDIRKEPKEDKKKNAETGIPAEQKSVKASKADLPENEHIQKIDTKPDKPVQIIIDSEPKNVNNNP